MREIGVTCSGQRGADDSKTLSQAKFQIGDYLDINITPPNNRSKEGGRQDNRGGRDRDDDRMDRMDRMDRRRDDRHDDRRRDRRDRPY